MGSLTRTFPSTLDAAVDASAFVLEAAEAYGLSEDITQQMLLVIGEAVANAAGHGNEFDPEKEVVVEVGVQEAEVRLCVQDQGGGIPQDRLEHATLPDDLLQTSGRGLYIMKSLTDRIWIEGEGRRLCMMWRRVAAPS